MRFLGKIKSWDPKTAELIFKASFADFTSWDDLDSHSIDQLVTVIDIHKRKLLSEEKKVSYKLQKKWFVCLKEILDFYKVSPTKDNKGALDRELRKQYLPVTRFNVGDVEIISVPSVSYLKAELDEEGGLSFHDLRTAIENLMDDFTRLGVKFNDVS